MTAAPAQTIDVMYQEFLVNYLLSMARTVELSVDRALAAIAHTAYDKASSASSQIFLLEPRINEMEMIIDDYAVRILRDGQLSADEIHHVAATLKISNDLERMGDLAVGLAERILSLSQMQRVAQPEELAPLVTEVETVVKKSLGALIFRNGDLATEIVERDNLVDHYKDRVFERLMASMAQHPESIPPNLQFLLASRYLERVADHAADMAEDVIFWVRGLELRHRGGWDPGESRISVSRNS